MCGQGLPILHLSLPNWGVHASPRGNDLPTSFSKAIILHLDTLLKSFNYHYFALSLWSHCDPLFRAFRFSAFYLLRGGRGWNFLRDFLGSLTSRTETSEWNQQAFWGVIWRISWAPFLLSTHWYSSIALLHSSFSCCADTLRPSRPWGSGSLCLMPSFLRCFANQFCPVKAVRDAGSGPGLKWE